MTAFDEVGKRYGMTGDQVIHYLLRAGERHADAEPDHCGEPDPRSAEHWCRLPKNHPGDHNRYRLEDLA